MPSESSPTSSSVAERIIPSEATPRSFALRSFSPPGIRAPGSATATVWPAATLGAPQTIVRSPVAGVDRADPQPVGVGVLLGRERPCRSRSPRARAGRRSPTRSTSVPVITRRSASSSGATPGSQYSRSQE